MTRWLLIAPRPEDLPLEPHQRQVNASIMLAGRTADPLRPQGCEVANSVAVFRELSWLTRHMAKVKLDRKAAGLRLAHLLRLRIAIGLDLLN